MIKIKFFSDVPPFVDNNSLSQQRLLIMLFVFTVIIDLENKYF